MTPEGKIENEIFKFLNDLGAFVFKHDSVGIYDPTTKRFRRSFNPNRVKGVSDILGIFAYRPLAIEVKTATGKVTPEQRVFIRRFQDQGGIAFVARSVKDVITELTKHFPEDVKLQQFNH